MSKSQWPINVQCSNDQLDIWFKHCSLIGHCGLVTGIAIITERPFRADPSSLAAGLLTSLPSMSLNAATKTLPQLTDATPADVAVPAWMTGWRLLVLWGVVAVSLLTAIGSSPVTRTQEARVLETAR